MLSTCTAILVMPLNIGTFSVSWKVPVHAPPLGTRAPENEQGEAVVIRHVRAGDAVSDTGTGGQHRYAHLILDIPIGGSGKGRRLLVAYPNGTDANSAAQIP